MQRPTIVHYLLFLLLAYLWGTAFLLIKISVQSMPPAVAAAGRTIVAGLILGLLAYLFRAKLPRPGKIWILFFVLGLFGSALPFYLLSVAGQRVDSMEIAVIMGLAPVLIPVFAMLFGARLAPPLFVFLGLLLGAVGFVVLVGPHGWNGIGVETADRLYVLLAAGSYALTVILSRLVKGISTEAMSFSVMFCSILIMVSYSLLTVDVAALSPSAASIAAVVVLGVFSTALASYLYFYLATKIGPGFVAPNIYLLPPVAIFVGSVFLDEVASGRLWVATLMILAGTAVANFGSGQWRQFFGRDRLDGQAAGKVVGDDGRTE